MFNLTAKTEKLTNNYIPLNLKKMKRITLIFAFVAFCSVVFGQSLNEKRAQYFTDMATKEFSLKPDQTKQLMKTRLAYHEELKANFSKQKSGDITPEENKTQSQEINKNFKEYMSKLTGKTPKELDAFYETIKEGLKDIK